MIERLCPLPSPASLRLIAFDLDGTLIDSRADLVAAVNATLGRTAVWWADLWGG